MPCSISSMHGSVRLPASYGISYRAEPSQESRLVGEFERRSSMTTVLTSEQAESAVAPRGLEDLPLCVDLDGTLVHSDTLYESVFAIARSWRVIPTLLSLLVSGRAGFKRRVSELANLDAAILPYNKELLSFLKAERSAGRKIVLATAADSSLARRVADHIGLFDDVIASNGVDNLRGRAKADALCRRFGEKGFIYAGNDSRDYAVWKHAAGALIVNAS